MKDRPECITLLITVILKKHDMDVVRQMTIQWNTQVSCL